MAGAHPQAHYNPNQPRDFHGRWTITGGGAASPGASGAVMRWTKANATTWDSGSYQIKRRASTNQYDVSHNGVFLSSFSGGKGNPGLAGAQSFAAMRGAAGHAAAQAALGNVAAAAATPPPPAPPVPAAPPPPAPAAPPTTTTVQGVPLQANGQINWTQANATYLHAGPLHIRRNAAKNSYNLYHNGVHMGTFPGGKGNPGLAGAQSSAQMMLGGLPTTAAPAAAPPAPAAAPTPPPAPVPPAAPPAPAAPAPASTGPVTWTKMNATNWSAGPYNIQRKASTNSYVLSRNGVVIGTFLGGAGNPGLAGAQARAQAWIPAAASAQPTASPPAPAPTPAPPAAPPPVPTAPAAPAKPATPSLQTHADADVKAVAQEIEDMTGLDGDDLADFLGIDGKAMHALDAAGLAAAFDAASDVHFSRKKASLRPKVSGDFELAKEKRRLAALPAHEVALEIGRKTIDFLVSKGEKALHDGSYDYMKQCEQGRGKQNVFLHLLYKHTERGAKPRLETRAQIDAHFQGGGVIFTRGVKPGQDSTGNVLDGHQTVNDFFHADTPYAGTIGAYGQGIYGASTDNFTTVADPRAHATCFQVSDSYAGHNYGYPSTRGSGGAYMRGYVDPSANRTDESTLHSAKQSDHAAALKQVSADYQARLQALQNKQAPSAPPAPAPAPPSPAVLTLPWAPAPHLGSAATSALSAHFTGSTWSTGDYGGKFGVFFDGKPVTDPSVPQRRLFFGTEGEAQAYVHDVEAAAPAPPTATATGGGKPAVHFPSVPVASATMHAAQNGVGTAAPHVGGKPPGIAQSDWNDLQAWQDKEKAVLSLIFDDVGHYAVYKGYDGYTANRSGNRAASFIIMSNRSKMVLEDAPIDHNDVQSY